MRAKAGIASRRMAAPRQALAVPGALGVRWRYWRGGVGRIVSAAAGSRPLVIVTRTLTPSAAAHFVNRAQI
jgi:hypothetical protein